MYTRSSEPSFRRSSGRRLLSLAPALAFAGGLVSLALAEPVPAAPAPSQGRAVYEAACAACHGRHGDGRGPVAAYFDPPPRDFTRGVYKFRTTASGQLPLTSDLARTIANGVPGTAMPAWRGKLPDEDIVAVAIYVQTFSPRFARAKRPPRIVPGPTAPAPDSPQPAEGRMLFLAMQCWQCHGVAGRGDGPSVATLKDDDGRALRATDFTDGTFRSGGSRDALFRTLSTGLSGTPMPAFRDAVIVGREAFGNLAGLAGVVDAEALARVRAWVAGQPTQAEVDVLPEEQRTALMERRLWALVDYVRSLRWSRGVLDYLFGSAPGRLPRQD